MAFPDIDNDYLTKDQRKGLPSAIPGVALQVLPFTVTLETGALASGQVSRIGKVRKGFRLWGLVGVFPDLDSGGSPALAWDLGDAGDQNRLIAASQVGRTAGQLNSDDLATTAIGHTFEADTDILLTVTGAAATAVAGEITIGLIGVQA